MAWALTTNLMSMAILRDNDRIDYIKRHIEVIEYLKNHHNINISAYMCGLLLIYYLGQTVIKKDMV